MLPGIWAALADGLFLSYPGPWGVRLQPVLAGAGCLVFVVAAEARPQSPLTAAMVPVTIACWELAPFARLWFLLRVAGFDPLRDPPALSLSFG